MKIPEIIIIESEHRAGSLAEILTVIGEAGIVIDDLRAIERTPKKTKWELTLQLEKGELEPLTAQVEALPNARILGTSDRVFERHRGGKIRVVSSQRINTLELLRDLYTPGVARVCMAIEEDPDKAWTYTNLRNTVAIVTNGTAILGLGNIGPLAGLPVMEGKAALLEQLVGLSGVPILIDSSDVATIVETVSRIAPSFGAIKLEDIRAPECFEIERQLIDRLAIPVMHDDQHGTAAVTLAALLTATRRLGIELRQCVVGQIGLGAAGIGIASLLLNYGVAEMLGADLNPEACARLSQRGGQPAEFRDLMRRADIVIATTGVKGLIQPEMVRQGQVILALSNPEPEIEPEVAHAHGARYAADGKAVNNVLGFPGIFRGTIDANASRITHAMLVAAAEKLSDLAPKDHLVPNPLRLQVHADVAEAVRRASTEA